MSTKNKKEFGVWMDTHHATIVGREDMETNNFSIIGHVKNSGAESNSSEKAENNQGKTLLHKFFGEILSYMQNVDELHVTGTGTAQEQLAHYMQETPQYKHTVTKESTSNKMSDEKLVEYISEQFN